MPDTLVRAVVGAFDVLHNRKREHAPRILQSLVEFFSLDKIHILHVMHDGPAPDTFARLMADFRKGDKAAANRLVELLYPELRKLAAAKMRGERTEHTWQPTLLVNELYLALVKIKALGERGQRRSGESRFSGPGRTRHEAPVDRSCATSLPAGTKKLNSVEMPDHVPPGIENVQFVEELLSRLAAINPRLRSVIEMRVFEGLTGDEIAEQLGCSPRTVASLWTFGKRWLANELAGSAAV